MVVSLNYCIYTGSGQKARAEVCTRAHTGFKLPSINFIFTPALKHGDSSRLHPGHTGG